MVQNGLSSSSSLGPQGPGCYELDVPLLGYERRSPWGMPKTGGQQMKGKTPAADKDSRIWMESTGTYGWWFRNLKQPPGMYKTM